MQLTSVQTWLLDFLYVHSYNINGSIFQIAMCSLNEKTYYTYLLMRSRTSN